MEVLKAAAEAVAAGAPAALVTIIGIAGSTPRTAGSRMLVYENGDIVGTIGGGAFEHRVIQIAQSAIESGKPTRFSAHLSHDLGMCCGGTMEAYIEPLETVLDLIIHGGGHVGSATARLAHSAGFRVTVIDERDDYADPKDFPDGIRVRTGDPIRILDSLPWGPSAFHLVVTHSHQIDQDLIQHILPRQFGWLGMIGSRSKVAKFFIRLRACGTDESLFQKLSAPVGLDIGAETPEEIAVSIVAELIQTRRNSDADCQPLSRQPIAARGGDGSAYPPYSEGLTDAKTLRESKADRA